MEHKAVLVDIDILNKVITYLARKPYAEVAELIEGIQKSVLENRKTAQTEVVKEHE